MKHDGLKLKYLVARMTSRQISELGMNSTFCNVYPALGVLHAILVPTIWRMNISECICATTLP